MPRKRVILRSAPEDQVHVPAELLAAMRVADGGAVSAQASPGRLVLTAPREIGEVQSELGRVARELQGLRDRLADMAGELPEPAEAVLRAEVPPDVETDVLGTLEVVLNDDLDPALRKLRAAASVTPEELRDEWRRGS